MSLLVRKIEEAKWRQRKIEEGEEPSADAITICMRTTMNALSVWHIETENGLPDAVLAQVAAAEHLDTMDFVLLRESDLAEAGLELEQTPGRTCVTEMVGAHRDVVNLNYSSLGILARLIVDGFKTKRVVRFTRGTLRDLLLSAIRQQRLNVDNLRESVRRKLLPRE